MNTTVGVPRWRSVRRDEHGRAGDVVHRHPRRWNRQRERHPERGHLVRTRVDRHFEVEAVDSSWGVDVVAGEIERQRVARRHDRHVDASLGDVDDRLIDAARDLLGRDPLPAASS